MASVTDRIGALRDRSEFLRRRWDERFALTIKGREGWREYLEVLSEHPGMSVHNVAAIVQHRLTYGVHDTQELLTYDQAKELGGHVRRGARAIPLAVPADEATRFETEFRFLARDCEGLDEHRYQGRARKVNPNDAESMDMFVRATSGIDLDGLGQEAEWAFERRYGLLDPSDALPPVPAETEEVRALVERCGAIQARLAQACRSLDRALALEAHPEWAERDVPMGEDEAHALAGTPEEGRPPRLAAGEAGEGRRYSPQEVMDHLGTHGTLPREVMDARPASLDERQYVERAASALGLAASADAGMATAAAPSAAEVRGDVAARHGVPMPTDAVRMGTHRERGMA